MPCKSEKHNTQGIKPRREKVVGLSEDVAILFAPMNEADYTWTKRAGVAGAGVLLGLLAAKALGNKGDYAPAPSQPPGQEAPQKSIPGPNGPSPSSAPVPMEKVFQREVLTLQDAKDFIAPSEGSRSRVYRDSRGKRTVGVGINLDSPGAAKFIRDLGINYLAVKTGKRTLSQEEIDRLFTKKVEDAMRASSRVLRTFEEQPKEVQLAVVDMVYNLGPTGFANFDTAVDALDAKDYRRAANALERSKWFRQVGDRAEAVVALVRSASDSEPTVADNRRRMNEAVESLFGGY